MAGRSVSQEKWKHYFAERRTGASIAAAARVAGIDKSTCYSLERGSPTSSGAAIKKVLDADVLPDVVPLDKLSPEAKRALDDFAYFRRRYFGRISSPWQEEAGRTVVEYLLTPDKEYIVLNCPPGSGKSTLWHDVCCWLICRDRSIRILWGSATQRQAERYTNRIRRSLARRQIVRADPDAIALGLAVDAEATLVDDFGRFKPLGQEMWRSEQFVVAQEGDLAVEDKEPTVQAVGFDTEYLGNRVNLCLWDDVVTKATIRTQEMREQSQQNWDDEAESRIEPGGCLVLNGQRLSSVDLYRYCLDKRLTPDADDDDGMDDDTRAVSGTPMYRHIIYKAHYPEKCTPGSHKLSAAPYPEGCLLDPRRLSFRELRNKRADRFAVVYQQEDVDAADALVHPVWIKGGTMDGVDYPGCWDDKRGIAEIPQGLTGGLFSVVTCDPSPTRFWAIEWWGYHKDSEQRFLLDLCRQAMEAPDFLDWDYNHNRFSGLLEEWWQRANDKGAPFSHVIVEANAAQRFLLQYDHVKRWCALRKVLIVPHQTHRNKSDEEYGVETIAPHYKYGRIRLPGKATDGSRMASMKLVDEVTRWPDSGTDDCHPAGVPIQTARGPVPVERVQPGDLVLTHAGRWRPVEAVGERAETDQIFTLRAAGALPLQATGNHPILVVPGYREPPTNRERYDLGGAEFIPAEKLTGTGRHSENPTALLTPFSTEVTSPTILDAEDTEFALLLGVYLAEGSVSDHAVQFTLNVNERALATWIAATMRHRYGCNTNEIVRGNTLMLACQSMRARADFDQFGRRDTKALPNESLTWPAALQRAVLRGWAIGDGCNSGGRFRGTSISRPLLTQMETFAARLGAAGRLSIHQQSRSGVIAGNPYTSKIQWALSFGQAAFARIYDPTHELDIDRWGHLAPTSGANLGMQVDTEAGYVIRKLRRVDASPFSGTVHSLQVADDRSYVAQGLAVHNCLMAHWFLEWTLPQLKTRQTPPPRRSVPAWLNRSMPRVAA